MTPTDELLAIICQNPSTTIVDVAEKMGRPLPTVRKHIARLLKQGVLTRGFTVKKLPLVLPLRAFIAIDFELRTLQSERFGYSNQGSFMQFLRTGLLRSSDYAKFGLRIRIDVAEVLLGGREDAFLIISCRDHATLFEFVTECLRFLPGVGRTNTAMLEQENHAQPP